MKKIIGIILLLVAFAFTADVKPFIFEGIEDAQKQYDYMLQYKLYGADYLKMGRRVKIPDKSGWNGSSGPITSYEQLVLGGPVLTDSAIILGNECQITTGPIRANTFTSDNDNGNALFAGNICLKNPVDTNSQTPIGVNRGNGQYSCDSVPAAPTGLRMPTITFPDTTQMNITVPDRGKVFVDIPDVPSYDLYVNSIRTGTEDTLYFRYANRGTLVRIFVQDEIIIGNHTVIQTFYNDSAIAQNKYRGNLLFYTNKDIRITNTDYVKLQGSFISTEEIYLRSNIDFSGQLLANRLELGDDFKGENFHFVKFDPDTIDVKLDKYGGLLENDSTVIIPIELSDTATVAVFFTYCFDLKDGVTVDDFKQPPVLPLCSDNQSVEVSIPRGSKVPDIPIQVNVKIDDIVELTDSLVIRIDSINGAILPNGETSGELKIKIVDAIVNKNYPIEILTAKGDTIPENSDIGTPCGLVNAKDGNDVSVSYSINTTEFKINNLGVITTNTLLDYETKNKYPITITIISEDGSKKDTNLVIYISDVDEPVHAHDMIITVPENVKDTIIGKVTGEDEDGKPIKFYSNDTLHYVVDSITGTIRLVEPFDYETTKNDTLKVIVKDVNGNTDTATVAIEIKNVNEPPVLQPNDSLTVPENCKSCIVGIITATDPDNDKLTYTVKEPGFSIDSNGVLKLTEPLDFEKNPEVKVTVIVKDPSGAGDTAVYTIKVTDINEPVHTKDTTCSVKENYTGNVCKITGTDEDEKPVQFIVTDTTNYSIDSTGQLVIKNPIDFEKKTKDTVKVIVTDGEFSDTATIVINIIDEKEDVKITDVDHEPKKDTIKTNDPNHNIEWKLCEGVKCDYDTLDVVVKKDTTIKVCNEKKTVCDSVVILFNDAPPVVTLTNAKSTDALIDYITIEEEKDDKIYVNKKNNEITVTVKDTVHKTEKHFNIDVTLDTVATKDIKLTEYNYIIDETKAKVVPIGNNLAELVEVIKVDGVEVELKQVIDTKTGKPVDTVQTVTYTKKVDGKNVVVSYKTDNLTGQKIGDYEVSYMIDSCTKVTYTVDDNKKIVKNKEGNIAYTIAYEYTDDYGNKASAKVEIIFDNIPPKVEILNPIAMESFNTNAIPVKWTVNGEVQDTLTLQRLEKGINHIIRRYVDKAGNVAEDTITVIMREAKDIDITLVHPVTKVDKDKVDEYYSEGHKYNDKKPYDVKFVDPKNDSLPDVIGVGFKVDIVLPSVSPTGSLATLDDIVKNGMIPVDDKGNIVGASTKGIPVETYVAEHCTDEFIEDYKKNGLNIPLYDVTYNLHLWVYTNNANYVNDFNIEFTLNDEAKTTSAGTVQMVIDWLSDKDGNVKAKNGHALGTGAYITKLWSKSIAKHRCDYKEQKKGDRTVKKDDTMKVFGYKRPNDK